ncbi:RHS repeat-associated core domain-containing protein, partial [Streptomyces lonegramiae]
SLPGVLPLVLERHYVSGHPCGGWFGRTWAGTLDQRLEIDDAGVVFIADDGMLLTYPVPEPGIPALPTSGPRWPLRWDGKPDSTFTITAPEHNRTVHFAPLPAGGRELALTTITDRTGDGDGDRIDITYNTQGAPAEIVHSGGYRIAVDTDPTLLRITSLRLLHGDDHEHSTTLISYGYDKAGNLAEVINSTGLPLRYQYDDRRRVTSWTDRNGTTYGYVYDHRGRVLRGIGPDGILSGRLHYDTEARTTRYTDSQGNTTTYVYNEAYKVLAEIDPLGNTIRTEWDEDNRHPVAVTDPLGHTTRYRYDDEGRFAAVEKPDGTVTEVVYDHWGLPVEGREPNGAVWRHAYDQRGTRTSTTDPSGATTHYAYDDSGHLSSVTDPLGHTTQVTTDAAGLPVAVTDPLGHTTRIRRGPHGQVTAVTDPLGHTTRYGWTIEGKPAWREGPGGAREVWQWDTEGNLAHHADTAGHATTYTHTYFDLPATRTDPDGATYTFTYDTELRLTQVTNPQGRQWRYEYDAVGRLVAETDFNGRTFTYTHDAASRLISRTNGAGETLTYTRDTLGRTVATRTVDGTETTFTYDEAGRLTQAANPDTDLRRTYDAQDRVLTETVNDRTTTYGYDAAGNRTERITPSGLRSAWRYDATGHPTSLTTADNSLHFAYDAAGRETTRTFGENVGLTQTWDSLDRLTAQSLTHAPDAAEVLLQHRAYAYRADDYLTEIRELTSGTRRFDLDPVGRVTAVHAHGWTETYAYDSTGNLTHATAPDHQAPGDRQFTGTILHRAGRTTYEHDTQGRLTRKTRKLLNGQTRTWTYTWNTEDRLTHATTPDGEHWHYTYDPLGRRTTKHRLTEDGTPADQIHFTWDDTRLAEQTTTDGDTTTWDYAPGTHRPLSQSERRTPPLEPMEYETSSILHLADTTPQSEYDTRFHAIITDLVGTPTELVAPDGTLAWQHRTTLWGTPLPTPPGTANCPLRFPGQYADPETGLHYNYLRYYDPEKSTFISADPLGLAPYPNHYSYTPNPYTWLDPLGLACKKKKPKKQASELNWNIKSRPTFGHSFSEHGAEPEITRSLTDRARSTGTPQGQWLNNEKAFEFLKDHYDPNGGVREVEIPKGMGQVIMPDGKIVEATHARLVPKPDGTYKTTFPITE